MGFEDDIEKTQVLGGQSLAAIRDEAHRRVVLVVIKGRQVGKSYALGTLQMLIGRAPECDIQLDDEGISRRHAAIEYRAAAHFLVDNASTNGIFVNGARVREHCLVEGDRVQIGSSTILKFAIQSEDEHKSYQQLYDSATRDALTGAFNKKYFADQLKTEFAFHFRHGTPLSLLLFDIDFFKKLNDGWGHLAGDQVLKDLAGVVQKTLRTEDVFARYGGEEFGVILRETDAERAYLCAERVRRAVEGFAFMFEEQRLPVTISVGMVTLLGQNIATPRDLVKTADENLYKAKKNGRNRVEGAF